MFYMLRYLGSNNNLAFHYFIVLLFMHWFDVLRNVRNQLHNLEE